MVNVVGSVREVREPAEDGLGDANGFQTVEENSMVDCIKGSTEVEEDGEGSSQMKGDR